MAKKVNLPATEATFTKENVPQLIATLEARRKELTGPEEDNVDLSSQYDGESISSITTVSKLLEISASVHARKLNYDQEIKRYGLEDKNIAPFSTFGKSVEQWERIIEKAIKTLINKVELEKVENALRDLSEFESEEAKLARRMEQVFKSATSVIQ